MAWRRLIENLQMVDRFEVLGVMVVSYSLVYLVFLFPAVRQRFLSGFRGVLMRVLGGLVFSLVLPAVAFLFIDIRVASRLMHVLPWPMPLLLLLLPLIITAFDLRRTGIL